MKPESKNLPLTRGLYLQYLQQRHQEAQDRPKVVEAPHGRGNGAQRGNARKNSDLSAEHVAHIRWLCESADLGHAEISALMGMETLTAKRVKHLCSYESWCDVEAAKSQNLPQP